MKVVVFALFVVSCSGLSLERVHLVDNIGHNFVFRGNEPVNSSNVFDYNQLVQYMQQRAQEEGNTKLPPSFTLVDISFLSPIIPKEAAQIKIEEDFFKANPQLGYYVSWPLIGDWTSPNIYSQSLLEYFAKDLPSWQIDQVPQLIKKVRDLLQNQTSTTVIYYHCEAGSDRTGEFSASYYMQYKNMTLKDALDLDYKIAGREIESVSKWAAEWYCWYLKYGLKYNLTCST